MSEKNLGGRPTKYKPSYNKQAYHHCLLGASDADLAKLFEVTETTINNWKNEHPKFFESLKKGKEIADGEVAASLYKRAKGYDYYEDKLFCSEATHGEVIRDRVKKHQPSDTAASMAWLTNRQPDRWRHRSEQKILGKDGETLVPIINIGGGTQS